MFEEHDFEEKLYIPLKHGLVDIDRKQLTKEHVIQSMHYYMKEDGNQDISNRDFLLKRCMSKFQM